MGTYATTTALDTIMVGVSFDAATTSLGGLCIQWAEDEVNKYLSKRYDISQDTFQTATSVPPLVRSLTEKLATAYLYRNISRGQQHREIANEYKEDALKNLELISDNKLHLLNTAGSLISDKAKTSFRIQSNTDTYVDTFAEDTSTTWAVDSDKLTDISSDRS